MQPVKILFVDDEEMVRKLGRRLLTGSYELLFASGRTEAVTLIADQSIDLLITDWRLHDGDGGEVIGAFRAKFPNAPCIVMTGFLDTDDFLDQIGKCKPTARFQKPFDISEFQQTVNKLLSPLAGSGDK